MSIAQKKRTLSLFDAICVGLGIVIGIGIFESAPLITKGVSSVIELVGLWSFGALISLCGALVYAELATRLPDSGGDYTFLKRSLGQRIAFLYAWAQFWVILPGSIAAISFPFAGYLIEFLNTIGLSIDARLKLPIAIAGIGALTVVNISFASPKVQNFLTVGKLLLVLLFVSCTFCLPSSYSFTEITHAADPSLFGVSLILVLFSFGGWSEIVFLGSELHLPKKNFLKAFVAIIALSLCTFLSLHLGFIWILGLDGTASSGAVLADASKVVFARSGSAIANFFISFASLGALQGLIFIGSRLIGTIISESKSLSHSPLLKHVERKHSYIVQGIIAIATACITSSFLGAIVYASTLVWMFYFASALALLRLRYKERFHEHTKGDDTAYTMPLFPVPLLVFALSCVYLIYSALMYDWIGSLISLCFLGIGDFVYRNASRAASKSS